MKYTKILLTMATLSLIVSFYRIYSLFLKPVSNITITPTGDIEIDRMLKESQLFEQQLQLFRENLPNRIIAILLLCLAFVSIFFYFKKYFSYAYASYLGYVGLNLFRSIYYYQNLQNLGSRITFKEAYYFVDLGSKLTLYGNIVSSILYILLVLYGIQVLYRKKSKMSLC